MSSSKWSHGLIAYLTRNRTDSKNENALKKKKKRRWLFRRATSQSSLQNTKDMYENFGGPFGPDGIQSAFTISPYEDVSPNSFFTEKGVQKDIDFQRNKLPAQQISKAPNMVAQPQNEFLDPFDDFALPESNTYHRPSLKNIFDIQTQGGSGSKNVAVTPSTRTSAKTSSSNATSGHLGGEEEEEEEDKEEDEREEIDLASPYEEDSFHLKPPAGMSKRMTPKTSGSSLKTNTQLPYENREGRRSLTEESAGEFRLLISNHQYRL